MPVKKRRVKKAPLTRDELITEHYGYVDIVVGSMLKKMGLPSEFYDEMLSAGYLGLVEAAERYDPKASDKFRPFAFLRIRGAVIDYIRKSFDLSGNSYRYARAIEAINELGKELFVYDEVKKGKENVENTLASILDFAARGALVYRLSYLDSEEELAEATNASNPEEILQKKSEHREILALIATLNQKERLVIEELYFKDRTITEIAHDYPELSKSWICRLHNRAVEKLQEALTDFRQRQEAAETGSP